MVISKGLDISSVVVTDVAISDHSCVVFESSISMHTTSQRKITTKRFITEDTNETFNQVFSISPLSSGSVNELTNPFYFKISNIMDSIAPTTVKVISGKKKITMDKRNAGHE